MMKNRLCTLALVLGLSPLAMLAPSAFAQDRDRDDRQQGTWTRNNDLQNALHQRVPNSNIAVNWQNNNTVVLTGTAATDRDRQYADQLVRSQVGNAQVIDQVTVNGYNSAYPNGYPNNGTYSNGYPNNGTYSNGDRDRDSRTDADRDRARTDNDRARNDNDRDDQVRRNDNDRDDHRQMSDKNRDHDKKYKNKKDKDKDKNKDKKDKDDRGDHDSDNRPH